MRLGVWVQLGVLAFMGGSLLRLGVETGVAAFTMFGMIAFLLIGLRVLAEISRQQSRAGLERLEAVLRRHARRVPILRLKGSGPAGNRYLAWAGDRWLVLGVDASSEVGLWGLVRPALATRARRLRSEARRLPLGVEGRSEAALVLVRRKVRERERRLGEGLSVRLLNPEDLAEYLEALGGGRPAAEGEPGAQARQEEAERMVGLARQLGAEALEPAGGG